MNGYAKGNSSPTMPPTEQAALSPRQAEIAEMIVRGKTSREIALALTLSPRTVETHIAAIYNKFGVSSRAQLMLAVFVPNATGSHGTAPAADRAKTNLPVRRTELVGRAKDVMNIVGMLQASSLVTLTGAGGIGKTQAALAAGGALLEHFPGGVWLVELAAFAHGSPVAEAVARVLGVEPSKNTAVIDALSTYLQRKRLLLIVDNCEHVIGEAAALAAALMQNCSQLKILATSREPLRVADEKTYRLPSLAVPDREDVAGLSASQGVGYAAIELFRQRAQAVDFGLTLDDLNTPIVAEICRKLDGIPLAIELAAARVTVLSLSALATKIDSHLRILAGGDRLALPRHQTMHALIDWSYTLLSAAEQRLFERMSVFAGGFALEQVAAVCSDEIGDEFAVLDLLSSLVDKSLLVADMQSSEPRYSLLQSFAHYASEKLESHGESIGARQRHASVYTCLAERLEQEYDVAPNAAWYVRAALDSENFLAALDWALAERRDVVLGQRLAAAMRPVWISTGGGRPWLHIACDLADERTPPQLAARLDYAAAWAGFVAGELEETLATSRRLMSVYQELGDPLGAAYAQSMAGYSLLFLGRLAQAEPLIAQALEVARSHDRALLVAFVLRAESHLYGLRGDLRGSHAKLAEALAIYERIGAERHATAMIGALAELEFRVGNVEYAFDLAARCLNLQRARRSRHIVQTLTNIAAYSVALNRWDHARAYSREVLGLAQEAQHNLGRILALQHLAAVGVLSPVSAASSAALAQAARLLSYVDACAAELGFVREYTEQQEHDRIFASLRATVPAAELSRYLAQGAILTLEEALQIALSI